MRESAASRASPRIVNTRSVDQHHVARNSSKYDVRPLDDACFRSGSAPDQAIFVVFLGSGTTRLSLDAGRLEDGEVRRREE